MFGDGKGGKKGGKRGKGKKGKGKGKSKQKADDGQPVANEATASEQPQTVQTPSEPTWSHDSWYSWDDAWYQGDYEDLLLL